MPRARVHFRLVTHDGDADWTIGQLETITQLGQWIVCPLRYSMYIVLYLLLLYCIIVL